MVGRHRYITCLRKYGYWKLQFPDFANRKPINFHFCNYGGEDGALLAAISYRDEFLQSIDLHGSAINGYIKNNRKYAINLCIHKYKGFIVGSWMATENGKRKQKKITRSFGKIRTEDEALALVMKALEDNMNRKLNL